MSDFASAYGMKRRSMKRMAQGGMAEKPQDSGINLDADKQKAAQDGMRKAFGGNKDNVKPLAMGGMADSSIADSIMKKRMMAEGGMVDLELNAEEMPAGEDYDDLNQEAALKENYDEGMHSAEDKDDMAERIRRKRMMMKG